MLSQIIHRFRTILLSSLTFVLIFSLSLFALSSPLPQYSSATPLLAVTSLPVFPGAIGFGSDTVAGRGGTVYKVTNLNDSGTGSLRDCINKTGPRVCVFETSGTIILASNLTITNPFITIAGQTAPSPGITLRGHTLVPHSHDMLIQHIRVRVGDLDSPGEADGIGILTDSYNVVVDHVSVTWAIDENASAFGATTHDNTYSNMIIAEGLYCSVHSKGCHSMGGVMKYSYNGGYLRSLIAHNNGRNPKAGDNAQIGAQFLMVNNLVYNWGNIGGSWVDPDGVGSKYASIVGNVYKTGVNSNLSDAIIVSPNSTLNKIYVADNERNGVNPADPWSIVSGTNTLSRVYSPPFPIGFTPLAASAVKDSVLANAGARPADRDATDQRIINDVRNGTGTIKDCVENCQTAKYPGVTLVQVPGGFPVLAVNTRTLTLPINPNGDDDGDGYTNLEEWLHGYSAIVEGVGTPPPPPPPPSFDFSLSNGGNTSVTQGSSITNTVTATLGTGTSQSISFSTTGLPTGATYSYSPLSCAPTCTTLLTINTAASTPTGIYTVTVTGTTGSLSHTTSFSLTVNAGSDTTAPSIPTGLTATAVSSSQINLAWTASTDNVGVTGYLVERCTGSGCSTFTQVATPTTNSYSDTGLSASTPYTYRVRATDAVPNLSGYSSNASAVTPAPSSTITFAATGDHGQKAATTNSLNALVSAGTNFYLGLGDFSYGGVGSETTWCNYIKGIVGSTYPFQLVSGNHEDDAGVDGRIANFASCLPDKMSSVGTYGAQYYFDYNNLVRVIMIPPNLTIGGISYPYTTGSASYTWLSSTIDQARLAGIPWVVVGMHKVCITMGVKACEIGNDLMNLFVSKKVDLVLQAHEHTYQRSKQVGLSSVCTALASGGYNASCVVDDGSDNSYAKGAGTIFLIAGMFGEDSGTTLYNVNAADAEAGYFAKWMGGNNNPTNGFVKYTVSATSISASFVRTGGGTFSDSFVITTTPPTSVSNLTFTPLLQGKGNISTGTSFTLNFYTPGTTTLQATATMASDATGKLTFPSSVVLAVGNYDILTATNGYLKKKQLNVALASNTTLALSQLTAGDFNSDNAINSLDWSVMNAQWFSANTQSDINGDGLVNSLDFSYLNSNWNKVGD